MIEFKPITLEDRALFETYLMDGTQRGCDYSFANLYLWGRQKAAIVHDHLVMISRFGSRDIYPFPVGKGDKKLVLDAILEDAKDRGIACVIFGMTAEQKDLIEKLYPGRFEIHCDRDGFDYVYDINNLADLKGRKYHRKRNHYYHFRDAFPNYTVEPLSQENLPMVSKMLDQWFETRQQEDPDGEYGLEQAALARALQGYQEAGMEGLVLMNEGAVLAVTMGCFLSENMFDVQFEKAQEDLDGAYTAINYEFARYIREKYPQVEFLNREDDMGIEGLRRAKESYYPHHMLEKYWAGLSEDSHVH